LVKLGLDAPDVADAARVYARTIADMELALKDHKWIVSDEFSLADICLAPYFQTVYQFDWTELFVDSPRVADWFARCQARSSYQQAVSDDFPPEVIADLQARGKPAWEKIKAHLSL